MSALGLLQGWYSIPPVQSYYINICKVLKSWRANMCFYVIVLRKRDYVWLENRGTLRELMVFSCRILYYTWYHTLTKAEM